MTTPKKPRIGIIGAGVIGGSIAKRASRTGHGVLVYDTDESLRDELVTRYNVGFTTRLSAFSDSDIIFICTPADSFESIITELAPHLRPGQILTDVASTKQSPVAALVTIDTGVTVVGGHPLAGSQASGFAASDADMFNGCVWVLCPPEGNEVPVNLVHFIYSLGVGRTLICTPDEHDRAVAAVSHGVQVAASSLAGAVMDIVGENDLPWVLAANGFKDSTRIAESTTSMWVPILLQNAANVDDVVQAEIARLERFSAALKAGDSAELETLIKDGQEARRRWTETRNQ